MCLSKIKEFLIHPFEAFSKEKTTSFEESLKYAATLLIVLSVLSGVVVMFTDIAFGLLTIPLTYIFWLIGVLLGGLILHVFAYAFGARKGINQTLKAALYAATPIYLFGWIPIPYILFVFSIWAAILEIIGLKTLQSMTTGRAILSVVIPVIIAVIVIAATVALLYSFLSIDTLT